MKKVFYTLLAAFAAILILQSCDDKPGPQKTVARLIEKMEAFDAKYTGFSRFSADYDELEQYENDKKEIEDYLYSNRGLYINDRDKDALINYYKKKSGQEPSEKIKKHINDARLLGDINF